MGGETRFYKGQGFYFPLEMIDNWLNSGNVLIFPARPRSVKHTSPHTTFECKCFLFFSCIFSFSISTDWTLRNHIFYSVKMTKQLVYCECFDLLKQTCSVNGQWKNVQFKRTFRKENILLIGISLVHNLLDKCAMAIAV